MVRVTADFGITGPTDFVDVHVDRDNRLFVDPSAIRVAARNGDVYGKSADASLTAFFDNVLQHLRSTAPAIHRQGEANLQNFGEVAATRLGLSKRGTNGHGAAGKLGTRMWDELLLNPLCQRAIATLKYVEDIPLFVDGIDKDITSDLTVRIILEVLENFTADMMLKHPEFVTRRSTVTMSIQYWDHAGNRWNEKSMTLPAADGKPLLLIPKSFVNYKIQMTYGQYYQVPLLEYIKWENPVSVVKGKKSVLRPRFTKKQLRTRPGLSRSRETTREQTARIYKKDRTDVLGDYRTKQQSSFIPLTDDQLDHYIELRS